MQRTPRQYPKVNSYEFKKLSFAEQVHILNLYLHHPDEYSDKAGVAPAHDELSYVNEALQYILEKKNRGVPSVDPSYPVQVIHNHWAAYISYFNPCWWEEGFSPLDELGLSHKRIFNLNLFTFPFIAFDDITRYCIGWLDEFQPRLSCDMLYYAIKMRYAATMYEEDIDFDSWQDAVNIWNLSVTMNHLNDIDLVNSSSGGKLLKDVSDTHVMVEEEVYVMDYKKLRLLDNGWYYAPLVPAEVHCKDQFYIKGWDFLTFKHEISKE